MLHPKPGVANSCIVLELLVAEGVVQELKDELVRVVALLRHEETLPVDASQLLVLAQEIHHLLPQMRDAPQLRLASGTAREAFQSISRASAEPHVVQHDDDEPEPRRNRHRRQYSGEVTA